MLDGEYAITPRIVWTSGKYRCVHNADLHYMLVGDFNSRVEYIYKYEESKGIDAFGNEAWVPVEDYSNALEELTKKLDKDAKC